MIGIVCAGVVPIVALAQTRDSASPGQLAAPVDAQQTAPAPVGNTAPPATNATSEDQGGLADIVVTAQKRAQNLQDVPVAITALTSEELVANRIVTVTDLNAVVPNLTVRSQVGGNSLPVYSMRGLVASGSAQGADRGVAVYIDGVYLGAAVGSQFELAEIERIEVLRGPQGTLFGRNSTGGAIHFITPEPPAEFGVRQTLTIGNYDQRRSVTRLNTGEFGPLSATFTYTHSQREGDLRNIGGGTAFDLSPANGGRTTVIRSARRLGSGNTDAVRAAVKLDVSDDFKLLYRFDYTDNDYTANGLGVTYLSPLLRGIYNAQPDPAQMTPFTTRRPKAVNNTATLPSTNQAWGHALTATYRASSNLSFKNILAYRKLKLSAPLTDVSGVGGLINTGGVAFNSLAALGFSPALAAQTIGAPVIVTAASAQGTDKQWSDEFQINLDTDPVTITAGALYYEQTPSRGNFGQETGLGRLRSGALRVYPNFVVPFVGQLAGTGGRATTVKIRSYAFFGQGELHVTPDIDLIGGIRSTTDRKRGRDFTAFSTTSNVVSDIRYDDSRVTFNLGANYKIDRDILLYGKYSTGYISGGSLGTVSYDPETAKSWEAGIKADLFDRILRTNLALFTVKYGSLQFPTSGVALGINPAITSLLINAGDARAKGFELETTLVPVRGVTLSAGAGYTDFKFTSLRPLVTAGTVDFLAQYRPKWTVNAAVQYVSEPIVQDARLSARIDTNYRSQATGLGGIPATFAGLPAAQVPAEQTMFRRAAEIRGYALVNGRLALERFRLGGVDVSAALWARNLFDYKGVNYAIGSALVISVDYERARTFGLDLTASF